MSDRISFSPLDPEELLELLDTRLRERAAELVALVRAELQAGLPRRQEDELLTSAELCELLKVDTRTLRRWTHAGELPRPVKIGGSLRWRRADLSEWLDKKTEEKGS